MIRTSSEHRISNFLLWQLAYAEIHVTDVLWLTNADAQAALLDFQRRHRRFGGRSDPPMTLSIRHDWTTGTDPAGTSLDGAALAAQTVHRKPTRATGAAGLVLSVKRGLRRRLLSVDPQQQ